MLKQLVGGCLIALCCGMAQAGGGQWALTDTGFHDAAAKRFLPDEKRDGVIKGADRNDDGLIDASELSRLVVAGVDFIACQTQAFVDCGSNRFAYEPGGAPDVLLPYAGLAHVGLTHVGIADLVHDPRYLVRAGGDIVSAVSRTSYRDAPGRHAVGPLAWPPATTFLISAVPEPTTYGMMVVGLGLVGVAARRQRRYLRG